MNPSHASGETTAPLLGTSADSATAAVPYKELVLAFSMGVYVLEQYLNIRQHRKLHAVHPPAALSGVVSKEDFCNAQAYGRDQSYFQFVLSAWNQFQLVLTLALDLLPLLWHAVGALMLQYLGLDAELELMRSTFFVIAQLAITAMMSLPFSLYHTFVIEERHGFNKQTIGMFFVGFVKAQVLSSVIILSLIVVMLSIIRLTGDSFYYYVWTFMVCFQLTTAATHSTFIQSLFNKIEPLAPGSLREKIE
ncbi:hypothetical protein THASP1DRAFT_20097, partial [Thamnocephalis sphaerospora]